MAFDHSGIVTPATATSIGGVKPGTGLTVAPDGTLNATGGGGGGGAGAWTQYSLSLTSSTGNMLITQYQALVAEYCVDGTITFVRFSVQFVGTGTADKSVRMNMPTNYNQADPTNANVLMMVSTIGQQTDASYATKPNVTMLHHGTPGVFEVYAGSDNNTSFELGGQIYLNGQFWYRNN